MSARASGVQATTAANARSRLLAICGAVGWLLGLLVAIAFLFLLWGGRQTILAEQRRSHTNADAFIAQVRACRLQSPGPMPSWSACEQRVRSDL
jgi:hypothetical protein